MLKEQCSSMLLPSHRDIPWSNCIGYSSDNASVMVGKNNSVLSRIREVQPNVFDLGCVCHLANLVCRAGVKQIPLPVEDLLIETYFHFNHSAKRREEYKEFLTFTETETLKIIKHCATRWLSLEKCVGRLLHHWEALQSYFNSHDEIERPGKVKTCAEWLSNPEMRLYYMFLEFILGPLNEFNTTFQADESMIGHLHTEMIRLLRKFLWKFVSTSIIKTEPDLTQVNFRNPENQLPDDYLAVGMEARRYLAENSDLPAEKVKSFFRHTRLFYVEATEKLIQKFPFKDPTLKTLSFVNPGSKDSDSLTQTCSIMDKVLEGINELCQQTAVQSDIQELLEVLVEVLDCYSTCFRYVQSKGDNPYSISDVHSLPYGAVHLLKGAYSHCKDSGTIYGDYLPNVTELLSALFKKAHSLQMSLLGMLEKISVDVEVSDDVVQDLCFICQGLFEVCQTVTSLDAKLVCSLWKTISRFAGRYSNQVKNDLDVDRMIVFLCEEIQSGYIYLFQLAPPRLDSMEMSLSQGDAAAFQKSLKVLSYQLRIMISLLDNFIDYVSDCEQNLFQLIVCIYRNLPPCLEAPCISETHIEEIQRQILNGTEPLISVLVRKQKFMECVTSTEKDLLVPGDQLPFLLILVKILDCIPKQTDDVIDKWMAPKLYEGDLKRDGLLECMFKALDKCYVEMSLTGPSEVTFVTNTSRSVSLYEYVCTHMCGCVGSIRARHFTVLEQTLLSHLLSSNMYVSTLVNDVWCFMARFGSADLCFKQTCILLDLCSRPELQCFETCNNVYSLTRRLFKFLAPEHQVGIIKRYPPAKNLWLYSLLPATVYDVNKRGEVIHQLVKLLGTSTQQLVNCTETTQGDMEHLILILQCINNCICADHSEDPLSQQWTEPLADCLGQLWMVWEKDWLDVSALQVCFSELIESTGWCLRILPDDLFLKIFDLMLHMLTEVACQQRTKLTVINFLINCRKFRFPTSAQQPMILKRIPQLFQKLLNDPDVLIHHGAVEAFTQFAEDTPHEEIVPDCLGTNQQLQDTVVSFLSKNPCVASNVDEVEYMKKQLQTLSDMKSFETTLKTDTQSNCYKQGRELEQENQDDLPTRGGTSDRDMLDDIICVEEPSLKRKRLSEDSQCGTAEVLTRIEKDLSDLELCPRSSFTKDNVTKLRHLHTRFKNYLDSV